MSAQKTFHYFGFGSNLLRQRIQLMNKSATFITTGKLANYKLNFYWPDVDNPSWCGGPATIEPVTDSHVWGVIWEMDMKDQPNLDRQESVPTGLYRPIEVVVEGSDNKTYTCRCYELAKTRPGDNRPSPQYMDVIIRGAIQNKLPEPYIEFLKSIEHNGYSGHVPVYEKVLAMIGTSE